ncbi:MAG: hypothetical protein [Caudoviricetes sp.]|nr:MAG: hypothetical protein [Caudoviricetes sp.]
MFPKLARPMVLFTLAQFVISIANESVTDQNIYNIMVIALGAWAFQIWVAMCDIKDLESKGMSPPPIYTMIIPVLYVLWRATKTKAKNSWKAAAVMGVAFITAPYISVFLFGF